MSNKSEQLELVKMVSKSLPITRRHLLTTLTVGTAAVGASKLPAFAQSADRTLDVLVVGGGIMSATLSVLLSQLEPTWTIQMLERMNDVALESSNGWNNAGTGHSALAELNYTPQDKQGNVTIDRAIEINESFQITRQFLSHQIDMGVLNSPRSFINSTPHMSFVWGDENTSFLAKRHAALKNSLMFSGMGFTEDRAELAKWVPLMMEGRDAGQKLAATWSPLGTDVNFGEITRQYVSHLRNQPNFSLKTSTEVKNLYRNDDGTWTVEAENLTNGAVETIRAKFVFLGAGGGALPLLQLSGIPEGESYAGFPVGGSFLVCSKPEIADRHFAKAYGQAETGAPPMSVPHLDTRYLDGKRHVLFGPFATFSTKFLKDGSLFDLPSTVTLDNIWPMLKIGFDEFNLVQYLAGQLLMSDENRHTALQQYYPKAKPEDWRFWQAGQRVQIIQRDAKRGGVLKLGTEIVASGDGSIAALLGASPGASTAPKIMLDLLKRVFSTRLESNEWQEKLRQIVPSYGLKLNENSEMLARVWQVTGERLQLDVPAPQLEQSGSGPQSPVLFEQHERVPDPAL